MVKVSLLHFTLVIHVCVDSSDWHVKHICTVVHILTEITQVQTSVYKSNISIFGVKKKRKISEVR